MNIFIIVECVILSKCSMNYFPDQGYMQFFKNLFHGQILNLRILKV